MAHARGGDEADAALVGDSGGEARRRKTDGHASLHDRGLSDLRADFQFRKLQGYSSYKKLFPLENPAKNLHGI